MTPNPSLPRLRFLLASLASVLAALPLWGPGCSRSGSSSSKRAPAAAFAVKETSPPQGTGSAARETAVRVTFSDEVDFATVSAATFSVEGSITGKKAGAYSHAQGSRSIAFAPVAPFAPAETVEVRLSGALRSKSGNALAPMQFSFTIAREGGGDPEPPPPPPPAPDPVLTVAGSTPRAYELDVALDRAVSVTFSEALDPTTATAETVWVSGEMTGRFPGSVSILEDSRTLEIVPSRLFEAGEVVTVHLPLTIKAAGGASFSGWVFQFRARADEPPAERKLERVLSALGTVSHLVSADFNSDRLADLVYASENESVIDVLLGRGDGTFVPALRIDAGPSVLSLAVADLDADGDPDILAGTADRARAYFNRAREQGPAPDSIPFEVGPEAPTGAAVRGMAAGDLDRSGAPDVILDTDRGLRVYLGGLGTAAAQVLGASRQSRTGLVLSDLDLDGRSDLVFGDRRGSRITYYLSSGSPEEPFSEPRHTDLGTDAEQIAVESLGGGSPPEIVVLTVDGASTFGSSFRILHRARDGYAVEQGSPPENAPQGAGGGDPEPLEPGPDTGRFVLADLDGNGWPDLVLAAALPGRVIWFPNIDGRFDFAGGGRTILGVPEARFPAVVDLTGDGSLDVLVAGKNEIHIILPVEGPPPPPGGGDDKFLLSIDDAQVHQKDRETGALVRITNSKPVQAFSVSIGYDPRAVVPLGPSLDGTITGNAQPELRAFDLHEGESAASFTVILDSEEPFDGRVLPAGDNQLLFRLVYDVLETAPLGETSFTILEKAGDPPTPTHLVVEGQNVKPETLPGKLTVLPPREPPPPPDGNRMTLGSTRVAPGGEGAVPVLATSLENIDAYTCIVGFNASAFEVLSLDLAGSATEPLDPDLLVPRIVNDEGYAMITVLFDLLPPLDKLGIPPGSDVHLFTLRLRARSDATPGVYPLEFRNQVGTPPLNNVFVFRGVSIFPDLIPGEIRIEGGPEPVFLRGDFDSSTVLDLSDAAGIVNHLFKGAPGPSCADAGDADDTGKIDLSDAIIVLNHLFKGGPPPAPPYPDPGVDPTEDELGCTAGG